MNLFLYSFFFWNIVIFCFFALQMFVMAKERVVNSKCIFMLFFGICSSFFGLFIRAILERVCQSCNIYNASPFLSCSFESIYLSIYLFIYLSTYQQSTYQSVYTKLWPKFSKSSFISRKSIIYQNRLSWNSDSNKFFIRTFLDCVDMYCH